MRSITPAVALVLLGATVGCSAVDLGGEDDPELEFDFESIAAAGFIDQTITITNPAGREVTATFTITPLDARGEPVPGVRATTALGSAEGEMILVAGENVDYLVLEGRRVHDVEDIAVQQQTIEDVEFPTAEPVLLHTWERGDTSLILDNPNKDPVTVGASLLVYDLPPEGEPQQIVEVIDLIAPTTLERGRDQEVPLVKGALRALNHYTVREPTSFKVYFTP